jgi:hypothetical protein
VRGMSVSIRNTEPVFEILCAVSLIFGWMFYSKSVRIKHATQTAVPAQIGALPAKRSGKVASSNAKFGDQSSSLYSVSTVGKSPEMTIDFSKILLTDKGRPRVSREKSNAISKAVIRFGNQNSPVLVRILYPSTTPENNVKTVERYFRSFQNWPVESVAVDGIEGLRVVLGRQGSAVGAL